MEINESKKYEEIMSDVVRIALSGNMTNEKIEKTIEELRKIKRKGGKGMLAVKERIDAEFRSYREKGMKEGMKEGRRKVWNSQKLIKYGI